MKPRISYLLYSFAATGGSMVLYKFMDLLSERGYSVSAITPKARVEWRPNFSREIIGSFASPRRGPFDHLKKAVSLSPSLEKMGRKILKKPADPMATLPWLTQRLLNNWSKSEITISTFCATSFANYLLSDKTLTFYHMQAFEELFFPDETSQKIARLTYYLPLNLISNSIWLRSQIKETVGRDSFLLNPGIDQKIFYPHMNTKNKYKSPDKISIVSYYSGLKFKAWDEALKAMTLVMKERGRKKVEWTVFGGIPAQRPNIPITFAGKVYQEDLARLYSQAHIVFMNSWFESFPLPPIEAMACGTAVVTTPIGTEDYAANNENSLVIPSRESERLAKVILKLIDNPSFAHSLADAGVDTARRFSWEKATDRLEEILSHVQNTSTEMKFRSIQGLLDSATPKNLSDD